MNLPDPRLGTVVAGRYRIIERRTEGSMGVVYRGERVTLKRPVAIKFLKENYAATDDGRRRFEIEARAMSLLNHPNCVPVTDFGVEDGAPYLVMDFVHGITLRQLLVTAWRVPPSRAVAILRQTLAGIAHAHAQGIIHRDIKPENILITSFEEQGEHVRIVDFGLAKLRDDRTVTTGIAIGTPGYMSPEQTLGERSDERADVYACGIILYELLSGAKPFQSEIPFEVMRMHREDPPAPLATVAAGVPISARLDAVVNKALAKTREGRYQSASEFRAALDACDEAHDKRGGGGVRTVIVLAALGAAAVGGSWAWQRYGGEASTPSSAAIVSAPAPASMVPAEPLEVAKLRAVATESGDPARAIAGLVQLRDGQPNLAAVHYALGNYYAETQAWTEALSSYANTVRIAPSYRSDDRLISDTVEALGSEEAHADATELIESELVTTALSRLDQASRSTNRELRQRASRLRATLRER
ncbi:MAG: serine/threonine protein kinase [Deltaproteobacteria bacterium]|nr:serine/threonine protein kinase [Deltaproteobacteria bacterium]